MHSFAVKLSEYLVYFRKSEVLIEYKFKSENAKIQLMKFLENGNWCYWVTVYKDGKEEREFRGNFKVLNNEEMYDYAQKMLS